MVIFILGSLIAFRFRMADHQARVVNSSIGRATAIGANTWFSRNQSNPSPAITCGIKNYRADNMKKLRHVAKRSLLNLFGGLGFQEGQK